MSSRAGTAGNTSNQNTWKAEARRLLNFEAIYTKFLPARATQ